MGVQRRRGGQMTEVRLLLVEDDQELAVLESALAKVTIDRTFG